MPIDEHSVDASTDITNGIVGFIKKLLPETLLGFNLWGKKPKEKEPSAPDLHRRTEILRKTIKEKLKKPPPPRRRSVPPLQVGGADNEDFDLVRTSSGVHLYNEQVKTFLPIDEQDVFIPEDLRSETIPQPPSQSPESNWYTTFHHLATLAAADERYDSRNIRIFTEDASSSSDGSPVPATSLVKLTQSATLSDSAIRDPANVKPSTAFLYGQRPFRQPKLAEVHEEISGVVSATDVYKFAPIRVSSADWCSIKPGDDAGGVFTQWSHPEPMRADKRLLPQIDPLVRYKLKRLGTTKVTPEDMLETQKTLALGISPSGRKLNGYSSSSAEECVYTRVMCKNDPDFDVGQPFVETESGEKWPNPFLYYCNWKKTDENANEDYLQHRESADKDLTEKRRIAYEICSDPLKIPYIDLGADDTDYEDPLGPLYNQPAVTLVLDLFDRLWKSKRKSADKTNNNSPAAGIVLEDPVSRRYQYLRLKNFTNAYRKYYQLGVRGQSQRRGFYRTFLRCRGNYTSSCCSCCRYPAWFYFWKKIVRHAVRKVPRKHKFLDERKTQTVFYGTFASIVATQYIVEHDLLPNMDDPILVSQLALQKAMEIKEHFLKDSKTKKGATKPYVDYIEMQRSAEYQKYMECIGLLCRYHAIKMPPRVRKVFFLNYFNVLSIQTQILRIPEKEHTKYLWEMNNFWENTKGLVGCLELSLEEIYHGILRCNRIHPTKQAKVFEDKPVKGFPKEMSAGRLSLDWMDPRIHFALNVGCVACPPIHQFSLYEQDCQLDEVAQSYVRSRVKVDSASRLITLPILLLWYEKDFGNNKFVMLWYLKDFMLPKDNFKIRQMLTGGKSIKFRYERFDYELDPIVRRHPPTTCTPAHHRRIIPMYWGSKY